MDCLPTGGTVRVPGPDSWEAGKRSVEAFASKLAGAGFAGTFFVEPEALEGLRNSLEGIRREGMELGLLCHPQLSGFQSYLGSYGYERHREIVHLAQESWQQQMGVPALSFRSGYFSANDYTFQILCMEGFEQGSCSLPGRIDEQQFSMWQRSYPFAHHTDPLDRTLEGTMEFYEVPVTSDFSVVEIPSEETFTPPHLRIEEPAVSNYARQLIETHLDRMAEDRVPGKTVTFVTKNTVEWGAEHDPHTERLQNLIALLREIADSRRINLAPGTVSSVHRVADERLQANRSFPE